MWCRLVEGRVGGSVMRTILTCGNDKKVYRSLFTAHDKDLTHTVFYPYFNWNFTLLFTARDEPHVKVCVY